MRTPDELTQHEKKLTRRVLWKLDIHVLPPLAFVRLSISCDSELILAVNCEDSKSISCGWPTLLIGQILEMLGEP